MNILEFQRRISQTLDPLFIEYSKSIKLNDFLYHYTSQDVLFELLTKKEIWFSHAFDMNDPGEIMFGINVILDLLYKNLKKGSQVLDLIDEEKKIFPISTSL